MYSTIRRTLDLIERHLSARPARLHKAYAQTSRLLSQLLGAIHDSEEFQGFGTPDGGRETLAETLVDGASARGMVTLTIREALPSHKEMTGAVQDHWMNLMQAAIKKEKIGSTEWAYFEKAFVCVEVETPRGSNNSRLWDTSNRAVNLIINNLKGVYFEDDDHEHLAFGVVGRWGEEGVTIIRILPYDRIARIMDTSL